MPYLAGVGEGVFLGAISGSPLIGPLLDLRLGAFQVDRHREGQGDLALVHAQAGRAVDRLAGVAHAIEAAVFLAFGGPALEAAQVELAVYRVEAGAVDAAVELQREGRHPALEAL